MHSDHHTSEPAGVATKEAIFMCAVLFAIAASALWFYAS
jgi:hypothetical protein